MAWRASSARVSGEPRQAGVVWLWMAQGRVPVKAADQAPGCARAESGEARSMEEEEEEAARRAGIAYGLLVGGMVAF